MLVTEGHAATMSMLIWVTCTAIVVVVRSRPGMLLRAMSGSTVLLELGSVLMSEAHDATKGHMDAMDGSVAL